MASKLSFLLAPVNWWARRTLAQRFATLTALLIAGGAIIQGTVLVGVSSRVVSGLEGERVDQRLTTAAAQLSTRMEEFRRVPLILSGTPPIERIADLSTGGTPEAGESLEVWLQRLSIIFRSMVQASPSLMQARFIGVADGGREIVRVNRKGDAVEIVDNASLQRKGDRPYFKEAVKLQPGEVYLSTVDANEENGVVEKPYQPMIRAATPIFTKSGELFGIIVVNAAANQWLKDMAALTGISGRLLAANDVGDYVYRSDGGPIFASHEGTPSQFLRDWPALGTLFQNNGPSSLNRRKGGEFVSGRRIKYDPMNPEQFIVIATDTDAKAVFGDTWSFILLGGAIALAMAIIGLIAAYFVSRPLKSLMSAAREIAAGKLDIRELAHTGHGADIGELGEALRIMKEAVETRDASLRKSEASLKAIVDNTIDGLITIDNKGIILRYNRGCEEIFGHTADEALGRNVSMLMPKPDSDRHDSYLARYARTGEKRFIGVRREATGLHKDGHTIDLEVAIAEIKVGGEVLFSGIVRDITERKKIDKIKSEFVSTVTHELRTPLTSIMGSLGLLQAGSVGELPDKSKRMVNLAYDNGARLVNLINDILDIDKIEAGQLIFKLQRKNLTELLKLSVEQNMLYAKQHGARIVVEDMPGNIILNTDPHRFHQVMGNLLSNAAKFSPPGGTVTVSVESMDPFVRVSVSDCGPGIPDAFRNRVFEKFAQADSSDTRARGGTGLGLSIAKALIEQMGGTIGYETEIGKGTTFYFDLPAIYDVSEAAAPAKAGPIQSRDHHPIGVERHSQTDTRLPRILHVENDESTRAILAEVLTDIANVTAAATAAEARALLANESFDLLILDFLLPDENGGNILEDLAANGDTPKVIVYSVEDFGANELPMVTRSFIKSRMDVLTLRNHILEVLDDPRPSPAFRRSA